MDDNDVYRELVRAAHDIHDYHEGLPGFAESQVWHDGCHVCEARGKLLMVEKLDGFKFAQAWSRAAELRRTGLRDGARAELPLLNLLGHIQNHLARGL
jgi:hypothetical protein